MTEPMCKRFPLNTCLTIRQWMGEHGGVQDCPYCTPIQQDSCQESDKADFQEDPRQMVLEFDLD